MASFDEMATSQWQDAGTYWLHLAPQISPEWERARIGRLTASRFGYAVGWNRRFTTPETVAREVAGLEKMNPTEQARILMSEGIQLEPVARHNYEVTRKVKVQTVGLAVPKWDLRLGASSDGLVDDEGMVEIKCVRRMYGPIVDYVRRGQPGGVKHIWTTHYAQMQGTMAVLGRKWCDYIVFCQNEGRMFVQRIYFDSQYWETDLYPKVKAFFDELLQPLLEEHKIQRIDP